jgi:hypothetical protein
VGTWNVGGRAPHAGLDLSDWLVDSSSPHIYVLGFVLAIYYCSMLICFKLLSAEID